jgi:hypothetical protein
MLTKVGQARPMLICTDCGLPVDQRESSALARQRLWGALTLVGMAFVSGAMLLLAMMYEWRTTGAQEGSAERTEEASGEGTPKGEERLLLEPSRLLKPQTQASGQEGGGPRPSLSAPPTPAATDQKDQQQGPAKQQR